MLSAEERFNLASFFRVYVEYRLELLIKNATEKLNDVLVRDTDTITFTLDIGLTGAQLKTILSGELEPRTAIKLMTTGKGKLQPGDHAIRLDKEPN